MAADALGRYGKSGSILNDFSEAGLEEYSSNEFMLQEFTLTSSSQSVNVAYLLSAITCPLSVC